MLWRSVFVVAMAATLLNGFLTRIGEPSTIRSRTISTDEPSITTLIRPLAMKDKTASSDPKVPLEQRGRLSSSLKHKFTSTTSVVHSSDIDEQRMCHTKEITITPTIVRVLDHKWKYIVNGDEYQQVIRTHVCSSPNKPCESVGQLPSGLSSVCRQKFMNRQLMALDPRSKQPVMGTFRIPSACVCFIREMNTLEDEFFVSRSTSAQNGH